MKLAVLITCFNRKEKTRACLMGLFKQELPAEAILQVFLCDDLSTDGTGEMLANEFPEVKVVQGNGKLYWGGGMRKAWELAKKSDNFDFYIWLNDDTNLLPNAIIGIFEDYSKVATNSLIVGACAKPGTNEFSYGGHGEPNPIPPSGAVQPVKYINGNFVLIPAAVELAIGPISPAYTHYLGDYDYAFRAQKAGFTSYTSSNYLAECLPNNLPTWDDPSLPLSTRWRLLRDVKGLALHEYIHYKSYHFGKWIAFKSYLDVHFKMLNPRVYVNLRNSLFKK